MGKYAAVILLIVSLSSIGCRQETCPEACGVGVVLQTVGFTRAQLNGAIVTYYPANNSFSSPTETDTISMASWYNPSLDSLGDTLIFNGIQLAAPADLELVIPATNETYKIAMVFEGAFNQNVDCFEGGKIAPCQGPYLKSYTLNGNTVSFTSQQWGNIYIYK